MDEQKSLIDIAEEWSGLLSDPVITINLKDHTLRISGMNGTKNALLTYKESRADEKFAGTPKRPERREDLEKEIKRLYYDEGYTQVKIALALDISQAHVSNILRKDKNNKEENKDE